jgi:nucleotide-binding universal stress UspA family protein
VTLQASDSALDVEIDHVLVPLDGSEFGLGAMPTARVVSERFGADIHTISVVRAGDHPDRLRALALALLDVDRGDEADVLRGDDPAEAIAGRAEALGRTVVCMTTHGRGRLGGAVVGSVARAVLQRSTVPVIALGPMADNPGWSPHPQGWPEPLSVPRMVACVDGSDDSEQVLPTAVAWGRTLGMSLTILTVVQDVPPPLRPDPGPTRYGVGVEPEQYIQDLVQKWRDGSSEVDGVAALPPIRPNR